MTHRIIRLSMLHASLRHNNVRHNIALLERLFFKALELEPDIIVMPELAVSGYEFFKEIGAEWIKAVVPETINRFCRLADDHKVAVIIGSPRYSDTTQRYYNAAIFIDEQGQVVGEHYKVSVLPGSEGWASPGDEIRPIVWQGNKIGLLICADAYTPSLAEKLAQQGAEVLISLAAWAPGFHGPGGEWEQRSKETGLSLYVCNRTGPEKRLTFEGSSSVVVAGGRRLIDYSNKRAAILSVEVKSSDWLPLSEQFNVLEV